MNSDPRFVTIYTFGSERMSNHVCGWGAVLTRLSPSGEILKKGLSGCVDKSPVDFMVSPFVAAEKALLMVKKKSDIIVYTNSQMLAYGRAGKNKNKIPLNSYWDKIECAEGMNNVKFVAFSKGQTGKNFTEVMELAYRAAESFVNWPPKKDDASEAYASDPLFLAAIEAFGGKFSSIQFQPYKNEELI